MSIACKPNAFAAFTIRDRAYNSSWRDCVRIIEVSAQSAPQYSLQYPSSDRDVQILTVFCGELARRIRHPEAKQLTVEAYQERTESSAERCTMLGLPRCNLPNVP